MSREPERYEEIVAALEVEVIDFYGYGISEEDKIGEALRNILSDTITFTESRVDDYETLYVEVEIDSKTAVFRHTPTPGGLWTFVGGHAKEGDTVAVTVVSRLGRRKTTDVWPFSLAIAEEMTRPAAPGRVEASDNDEKTRVKKIGNRKLVWGTSSGPPTWKLPKARIRLMSGGLLVQAGWLQTMVFFGVTGPKTADA